MVTLPDCMYKLAPHYSFTTGNIPLPETMYRLPMLQSGESLSCDTSAKIVELEQRQACLLEKLNKYLGSGANVVNETHDRMEIVIHADPNNPPHSLNFIKPLLQEKFKVLWKVYAHSSLSSLSARGGLWQNDQAVDRVDYDVIVTIIWKQTEEATLHLSPSTTIPVRGEANILRFFARLLHVFDDVSVDHDDVAIDHFLAAFEHFDTSSEQQQNCAIDVVRERVTTSHWLCGGERATIADAFVISTLHRSTSCRGEVARWVENGFNTLLRNKVQ